MKPLKNGIRLTVKRVCYSVIGSGKLYKLYLLCLIIIACGVVLKAGHVHPLLEIMKPNIIAVNENLLYISDRYSIIFYSLDDFSILHRFGRKGDGPQEFSYLPFLYFFDEKLWVKNGNKIIIFSKEMKLIKEMRVPIFLKRIYTFGDNYILDHNEYEKNTSTPAISIFDKEFKIYDLAGNKIKEIKKSMKRMKTGESQKRNRINEVMRARVAIRNWYRIKNKSQFPENLPLMRDIHTADKKLFIKTWGIKNDQVGAR